MHSLPEEKKNSKFKRPLRYDLGWSRDHVQSQVLTENSITYQPNAYLGELYDINYNAYIYI